MLKWIIPAVCALSVSAACSRTPTETTLTIAVIPKGTAQVYWQSIHAGAERAAHHEPPTGWGWAAGRGAAGCWGRTVRTKSAITGIT